MKPADVSDVRALGRDNGARQSIHLVHPVGGAVFCYLPLARRLAPDLACHAFESPLLSSVAVTDTSVPGIARRYAAQIDTAHPVLGGWSVGGVIAYEMVRQMHAEGRDARLLVLLDAPAPGLRPSTEDAVLDFTQDYAATVGDTGIVADTAAEHDAAGRRDLLVALLRRDDPELTDDEIDNRLRTFTAHRDALHDYRPAGALTVPALVAVRADGSADGWAAHLSGPVRRHRFPTDHYGLLRPPSVDRLAEVIAETLTTLPPGRTEEETR